MVAAGIGITTAPLSLAIEGTVPLRIAGYDFRRELGLLLAPVWMALPDIVDRLTARIPAIEALARDWHHARVERAACSCNPVLAGGKAIVFPAPALELNRATVGSLEGSRGPLLAVDRKSVVQGARVDIIV